LSRRKKFVLEGEFFYWDDSGGVIDVDRDRGRRARRGLARAGAALAAAMLALIDANSVAAASDISG
jgi:hypothetical protein